jgi:hypothetical protein
MTIIILFLIAFILFSFHYQVNYWKQQYIIEKNKKIFWIRKYLELDHNITFLLQEEVKKYFFRE